MKTEKNTLEIKHSLTLHTNGGELSKMIGELEALVKRINEFKLKVLLDEPLVQELSQQ